MLLGYEPTFKKLDPYRAIYNPNPTYHTHLVGRTGCGKSTAMVNYALENISNRNGLLFIDPHGNAVNDIYSRLNYKQRRKAVVFDVNNPQPFNIFRVNADPVTIATMVTDIFRTQWEKSWGPYPELYVQTIAHILAERPNGTLFQIKRFLTDEPFRNRLIRKIKNPELQKVWKRDVKSWSKRDQQERPLSTINKLIPLITDDRLRVILDQAKSSFLIDEVMQNKKHVLCNLDQGVIGQQKSMLLGNLITTAFYLTALRLRVPFSFYIDEAQRMGPFLANMYAEGRKFGLSITTANQYLKQFSPEVLEAVLGSVGTLIAFRTGVTDGKLLMEEFEENPARLPPYWALVRTPEKVHRLKMPCL